MWGDTGDRPDIYDVWKLKDYGGHLLLHNMAFLSDDPAQPKYENDYTYPLQRDRQIITDNFGYTFYNGTNYWIQRGAIEFDFSSIGTDAVSSATLSLYAESKTESDGLKHDSK